MIKIRGSAHENAWKLLNAINKKPAQNITFYSKETKIELCRTSNYIQTFLEYEWIIIQTKDKQKFITLTDKGQVARITNHFIAFNQLPENTKILEDSIL